MIDWGIVFLIIVLICAADIKLAVSALTFSIFVGWYIVLPIFILWAINVILGGEACFIAILLAIGIGIYYFHTEKELNKNK